MISLKNISVAYGDNVIYDKFDFDFPEGLNVVLGASGSGKTTLLNVICNLIDHGGTCECGKVSAVFQNSALAPTTALNNVKSVLRGKDSKTVAAEMLRLCHIEDKQNERATRLSGGEQQRVALARAFAANRPVLLLDEPFRSLDLGVRRKLYSTLDELLAKYTKTVVLVTHDVDEAICLADRIYLLRGHPATLSLVAEESLSRSSRDEDSQRFAYLKKTLKKLLTEQI